MTIINDFLKSHKWACKGPLQLKGIEQALVSLPVHDAIVVKQGDADWAKEAMKRVWSDEIFGWQNTVKC